MAKSRPKDQESRRAESDVLKLRRRGAKVVGDGMLRKAEYVKQGDLDDEESCSGVRASAVVIKPL